MRVAQPGTVHPGQPEEEEKGARGAPFFYWLKLPRLLRRTRPGIFLFFSTAGDSFLFFHFQIVSEFGDQRLRAQFWPAISIGDSDCKLRCDGCQANILESLIAVLMPKQRWQATAGLVVGGARTVLFKDGSNHPMKSGTILSSSLWRFHAGGDPVVSMCAGCRRGYLPLHKKRRHSGVAENLRPTIRKH